MNSQSHIIVIGATSSIVQAAIRLFAQRGDALYLVARSAERLEAVAQDARVRGASVVHTRVMDITRTEEHAALFHDAHQALSSFDAVLIGHGVLPPQSVEKQDAATVVDLFSVNATSTAALLMGIVPYFERQNAGCIAVITSVAGERARRSNYPYAASKAAMDVFLDGLRMRLASAPIRVLTIRPGFVSTPMTRHMKTTPLFSDPGRVGRDIVEAMSNARRRGVVYTPGYWRVIMFVIRNIPEFILRRLSF